MGPASPCGKTGMVMKPHKGLWATGSDTSGPYATRPPIQALLQNVDRCDSHFTEGKTEATRPRATPLVSSCSSSETRLLTPSDSCGASEPVGSEEPRKGTEECHCRSCGRGVTCRLRKQLGQRWERCSESVGGTERGRDWTLGTLEERGCCPP